MSQLGIDKIFGVPGDYASPIDDAAVATILQRLAASKNPLALVTGLTSRYGLRDCVMEFIKKANIPVAVMPNDKGAVDEFMPQFMGLYAGMMSSSQATCDMVTSADLVLDIGGIAETELNNHTNVPKLVDFRGRLCRSGVSPDIE